MTEQPFSSMGDAKSDKGCAGTRPDLIPSQEVLLGLKNLNFLLIFLLKKSNFSFVTGAFEAQNFFNDGQSRNLGVFFRNFSNDGPYRRSL